jgi:hypothetical protein
MNSATQNIAAYCRAESSLKAIDDSNRQKRTELYDCTKTLKNLLKEQFQTSNVTCVDIGSGKFIRLKTACKGGGVFTPEEILEACSGIELHNAMPTPNLIAEAVSERLKLKKSAKAVSTSIVLTENKDRQVTPVPIHDVPTPTKSLIHEMVQANDKLVEFRKSINDMKREHLHEKKKVSDTVIKNLEKLDGMKQQVQLVDTKNGLEQRMILKGSKKQTSKPLNLKAIVPVVLEAAQAAISTGQTPRMIQTVFVKHVTSTLQAWPTNEKVRITLNKRDVVVDRERHPPTSDV